MVSRQAIAKRKRYAEDPEYREKMLAYSGPTTRRTRTRSTRACGQDDEAIPNFGRRSAPVRRRRDYGMSDPDYEALLARQGGVCAICGRKSRRRLVVDHCHVCDQVRGLLCHNCNLGLGNYCDDIGRLQAAIAYLQRSRRQPALSTGPGGCSCDLHIHRGQPYSPILRRRFHRRRASPAPSAIATSSFTSREETT